MPRKRTPPSHDHGVQLYEGVPGSGKSFEIVRRMCEVVAAKKRPVYTNLPLNWQTLRAYLRLKNGRDYAQLVHDLGPDPSHFIRFCRRFVARKKHKDSLSNFRDRSARLTSAEIRQRWYEENGPDITAGPEANWITPHSLIVIDEAQFWFPMHREGIKKDDPDTMAVQEFLTIHRHGGYWVWFATQSIGMLNIALRRFPSHVIEVRNLKDDKFLWGIKFKYVGIRALGYAVYTGEQKNNRSSDNQTPIENYITLLAWPANQVIFRLYNSQTHLSADEAESQLEHARELAGVADSQQEKAMPIAATQGPKWTFLKLGGLIAAAAIVFVVARMTGGPSTSDPAAAVVAAAPAPGALPVRKWGAWKGSGPNFVLINGRRVNKGDALNDAKLLDVAADGRGSLWLCESDVWVWKFGDPEPARLGKPGIVAAALGSVSGAITGGGVPRTLPAGAGAVGPSAGNAPR